MEYVDFEGYLESVKFYEAVGGPKDILGTLKANEAKACEVISHCWFPVTDESVVAKVTDDDGGFASIFDDAEVNEDEGYATLARVKKIFGS